MASELLQRTKQKFNVSVAVKDLFSYPSIFAQAKLIDKRLTALDSTGSSTSLASDEDSEPKLDLMSEVTKYDQGVNK